MNDFEFKSSGSTFLLMLFSCVFKINLNLLAQGGVDKENLESKVSPSFLLQLLGSELDQLLLHHEPYLMRLHEVIVVFLQAMNEYVCTDSSLKAEYFLQEANIFIIKNSFASVVQQG